MEFVLVSTIVGLGFALSKSNRDRFMDKKFISPITKNQIPSGENTYANRRTQEVWDEQQQRANEIFSKSKNGLETNYMIAGPPAPIFNKVDGTEKQLPITFRNVKNKRREPRNYTEIG